MSNPPNVIDGLSIRISEHSSSILAGLERARIWYTRVVCTTQRHLSARLKRAGDFVGAVTLLLVLSPLLLVIAGLIKLTDGGSVLFWQTRVGRWGRPFWFPKFRSMVANAEQLKARLLAYNDHGNSVTFKMKRDPRVTWIGRIIRKASIDELPQLWCVLKGEMSLVGPRPPVPQEVAKYTMKQRRRLEVSPGLTCLWQISGRGDLPFPRQVELDIEYIETQSLWTDLRILVKTIPAVALGRGAY
ncbi:MAG: sugar transferase [Planctomycetes bacterium]|nr:sugar transferase [Planctomycetota bacterium]